MRTQAPTAPSGPSVLRRALHAVAVATLFGVVVLAMAVAVVPAAVGGSVLSVGSPSMVPTLPVGSLVVVRPRAVEDIRIGDVVAFTDRDPSGGGSRTVAHRVVGIDPGPVFRTKGDANPDPDPTPVAATAVRGVQWYALPRLGGWGAELASGPGLLAVGATVLLLVATVLRTCRRAR